MSSCIDCGVDVSGKEKRCAECRKIRQRKRALNYYYRKKAKSVCMLCGKHLNQWTYRCPECREDYFKNARQFKEAKRKLLYESRKANGICVECKGKAVEGHVLCEKCLENERARAKIRYARMKNERSESAVSV